MLVACGMLMPVVRGQSKAEVSKGSRGGFRQVEEREDGDSIDI